MDARLKSTTRVQVMVEIEGNTSWSGSATMDQIYTDAKRNATGQLNRIFRNEKIRVVGDMKVFHIISDIDLVK